ncbi:hypothetical protein TIFTF001_050366 [Ficus carica]|uniref:Uncharacterized protein n=1 Tax=Ficus carica TaxID=3494 RepID=A0AA88CPX7_FICCA|nr:hypothetical protein TIFTF001_050366 [Ficus carica]
MAARHVVLAERKLMSYVYAVGGSLQSWYQSGFPTIQFHSLPASATVIVFHGMSSLLIDGTRKTISLAGWLEDMEIIFQSCHIESAPSNFHALIIARYGPVLSKVSGYDAIIEAEIIAYMEIPPQEVETNAENNKVDLADFLANAEDSPVIIIANDDDEEDAEEEIEDVEVNPEEILFGNDD